MVCRPRLQWPGEVESLCGSAAIRVRLLGRLTCGAIEGMMSRARIRGKQAWQHGHRKCNKHPDCGFGIEVSGDGASGNHGCFDVGGYFVPNDMGKHLVVDDDDDEGPTGEGTKQHARCWLRQLEVAQTSGGE